MTEDKPVVSILGGTGKEGPGLAMRWVKAGYRIIIGSRQIEKAQKVAANLNELMKTDSIEGMQNDDAARCADISVLTVVQTAHQPALRGLKDALQGKILVDATARVDFRNPVPPTAPGAAVIAQEILGEGVIVVAAFQNVPAHMLRVLDKPISSEVLICADDIDAAKQIIKLADDGGMRSYYAGGLINAVTVEGLTAILININKHYKTKTASIGITGVVT